MGEGERGNGEKRKEKLLGCVLVSALQEEQEEQELEEGDRHHGCSFVCGRRERAARDECVSRVTPGLGGLFSIYSAALHFLPAALWDPTACSALPPGTVSSGSVGPPADGCHTECDLALPWVW